MTGIVFLLTRTDDAADRSRPGRPNRDQAGASDWTKNPDVAVASIPATGTDSRRGSPTRFT